MLSIRIEQWPRIELPEVVNIARLETPSMSRIEAIITGVAGLSALAMATPAARAEDSKEAALRWKNSGSLKAHDKAMTNHDLKSVMACLTEKAAIMGTGPGEIWLGPEDIKVAYEHFFEGFDKGEQNLNISLRLAASPPTWAGSWRPAM